MIIHHLASSSGKMYFRFQRLSIVLLSVVLG